MIFQIQKHRYVLGFLCMMVTNLCYGFMPAITQKAFSAGISPQTLLLDRFIVALLLIWGYIYFAKKDFKVDVSSAGLQIGVLGLLNFGVIVFLTESYKWLPGSVASLLVFTYVSIVIVLEILIRRTQANMKKICCLLMSFLGLILVIYKSGGEIRWQGIAFAMLTATCYALYSIGLGGQKIEGINSISLAGWLMLVLTLLNLIRCGISGEPFFISNTTQLIYVLILGFFCSFLGPLCIIAAIKYIGSGNAAINNTLEPVIAYLVGIMLMGELVEIKAIIGGIIILLSIIALNVNFKKSKAMVLDDIRFDPDIK